MITQVLSIPYDETKLTDEEIWELEDFCVELGDALSKKIQEMGLHITEGIGWCITKFTEEELEFMKNKFEEAKQLLEEENKG